MIETIEKLSNVARYLKETSCLESLMRMQQALEKKEYILTVMGQFSAGKSRLINNLLDRVVLPVHITETTAFATVIQYGENDHVELFYKDGAFREISVEESLNLWQSGEGADEISNLEGITVYVNCELLKNGLVIVDTPGINTIIQEHIVVTTEMIEAADRVLYVMGKSVTDTDLTFVKSIRTSGVKLLFVRTHLDELKSSEEKFEDTICKEREIIAPFTEDEAFFLSNEEDSPFYRELEKLREYLSVHLAKNVEEVLKETISERLIFIAERLSVVLSEKMENLKIILDGNREEYDARKRECEDDLKRMETVLEKNRERLSKKYEGIKSTAFRELENEKIQVTRSAQSTIASMNYGMSQEDYYPEVESLVKNGCLRLQKTFLLNFDQMLHENKEELERQLSEFHIYSQFDVDIPETLLESDKQVEELKGRMDALESLKQELDELLLEQEAEQKQNERKHQELLEVEREMQEALEAVKEELEGYPEYVTRYVTVQGGGHHNEDSWRKAGKIADLVTILIPGAGWAKLGSKVLTTTAKGAKLVKATKVAQKLTSAAKIVEKSTKIAKVIDTGADAVRMGQSIFGSEKKRGRKSYEEKAQELVFGCEQLKNNYNIMAEQEGAETLLDYFTIEHYFAKIGKKLDKPPVLQIDHEYEEKYRQGKLEIQQRMRKQAEEEYKKRLEILDIKEKEEQAKMQAEITKKKQKAAEAEIAELEKKKKEAEREAKINMIRCHYSDAVADRFSEFCEYLKTDIFIRVDKNVRDYISTFDFGISSGINKKRRELEEMERQYDSMNRKEKEAELFACMEQEKVLYEITARNVRDARG